MALNKQIKLYAIDTAFFYNEEESKIHKQMNRLYIYRKKLEKLKKKSKDDSFKIKMASKIKRTNKKLKLLKGKLIALFKRHMGIRTLKSDMLRDKKVVAMFDSTLTRAMGLKQDELTDDIFIVQTYFFNIIEDIILNGFVHNGEKYVCFTASAGQIRTKKTVFIKESVLNDLSPTLMCGLTFEKINKYGGININKYLAYLALCSSATDLWKGFDIDKTIVVDDMETCVKGVVDFICDETYKVQRKEMDIEINLTDGCGMILPRKSKKNFMVRLPWIKGLLVSFPFDKFIEQHGNSKVVDIYGVEHDVLAEGIEVIFTKSQFKMYQYYNSWTDYVYSFKRYGCQAGICNEEEDYFENSKINYQMLQTLTDITDEELTKIAEVTNNNISNIGRDRGTMLRILGVTKGNANKNNLQKALEIYPELLGDFHCREVLKQTKKKVVNEGRAGKLDIQGKYTFISPDLYAFCEYLFLGNKKPNGLLHDGDVYCNLYKGEQKLDCLRSPHLYREHAVRNNVVDEEKSKWFVTDALYVSCHDLISKLIMCDFDGDKSLVVVDKTIIEVAERNMKGIVPLYYNMMKAGKMNLNSQSIYYGLKTAYTGGNIGMISNDITKIWNSDNVDIDVIKLLCMENNYIIDHAKTLYKPERPMDKHKMISNYTKSKTPHFFIYAKDKEEDKVEPVNNSTVNRLERIVVDTKISFKMAGLKKFDYTMLMNDKKFELDLSEESLDSKIIELYKKLDLGMRFETIEPQEKNSKGSKSQDGLIVYQNSRSQLLKLTDDLYYLTDVLIKHLYGNKSSKYKTTLWRSLGDIIVANLQKNVLMKNNTYCEVCGDIIEVRANNQKYCEVCWKDRQKVLWRESKRRKRQNVQVLKTTPKTLDTTIL